MCGLCRYETNWLSYSLNKLAFVKSRSNMPVSGDQTLNLKKVVMLVSHICIQWSMILAYMSRDMRFPTMWYVRPVKPQISLRIRAVWSESLLVAWIFYECRATDWASFGDSKLQIRLHRFVCVYTCQNTTLLEISYRGSYISSCEAARAT